jgi:hypothetical protein
VSVEVFRSSAVSSTPNILSLIHALRLLKDSKCGILALLLPHSMYLRATGHHRYLNTVAPGAAVTQPAPRVGLHP